MTVKLLIPILAFYLFSHRYLFRPEKTPAGGSMPVVDAKAEKTGGSMRLVDGSMKAKAGKLHTLFLN
jgi:hypothetical protein